MFTRTPYGRSVSSLLLIAFILAGAAWAQSTGTITGTVTDQTGSVIPNAAIVVKNQDTGENRTTATDDAGLYLVPSLPVGKYRVEVKSNGMQPRPPRI